MEDIMEKLFSFILSFMETIKNFVANVREMNDA